jgi:hypothetical protein
VRFFLATFALLPVWWVGRLHVKGDAFSIPDGPIYESRFRRFAIVGFALPAMLTVVCVLPLDTSVVNVGAAATDLAYGAIALLAAFSGLRAGSAP